MLKFVDYVCDCIRAFDWNVLPTHESLDKFDSHICEVLDEYRHIVVLFNTVNRLKQTTSELKNKEQELESLLPGILD